MDFDAATLPAEWQIKAIREITLRTSQRDPSKQPDKTFRYVDVSGVDNALFRISGATELTGSEAPSRARKDIRANDVLFATVRPTLKRVALVPPGLDGEIASTGYCVLRSNTQKVEPSFLYNCLLTDWFIDAIGKLERGANYPAVRDSDVFNARIPLPPLPEQRKIAAILSLVHGAIEQQERLIASTTGLKKALMHKLFTEGLRGEPQKMTEIGPVPESWDIVRLGDVCSLSTGTTPSTARADYYSGEVVLAKTTDITNNRITETQTHISDQAVIDYNLKLYPPGTILMAMYGQGKTRGQVSLLERSAATTQNAAAIQPSRQMNAEFLWQYLMNCYLALRGAGALGHISHLNLGYVRNFPIMKPPLSDQTDMARILGTVDRRLVLAESRRLLLSDLFRTLLRQLMTARIRVRDLDLRQFGTTKED